MLRKRSRTFQKDHSRGQLMADLASDSSFSSDSVVQKARSFPFFSVPGLFVGFTTKGLSDSDSARSPTSPLDYKVFSNLGNSVVRSPRSPGLDGHPKSWDCSRVGLGLVDSLNDESKSSGKVLGSSESRNILFGSQMRINIPTPKTHLDSFRNDDPLGVSPKSLPKNYEISSKTNNGSPRIAIGSTVNESEPGEFEKIQSCSADISGCSSFPLNRIMYRNNPKSNSEVFSLDSKNSKLSSSSLVQNLSGSLPIIIGSAHGFMGSLSASEIEQSEDYTCIISHGPNPKTTHIFGDCILESHTIQSLDYKNKNVEEVGGSPLLVKCSDDPPTCPSDDFLSYCFSCQKKLEQGNDIYMYGGDKAFCSCNCRDQEILFEEEMEKPTTESSADYLGLSFHEEIFLSGMAADA